LDRETETDGDTDGLSEGEALTDVDGLALTETLTDTDGEALIDTLWLTDGDKLGLADIETDADMLGDLDTDTDGDKLLDADADTLGDFDTETEGDKETETDGVIDCDELGARLVKRIHDNAPSSPSVPPVQFKVCVAAVVDFHVVCLWIPTSASISSPATDHVFATVSVAHPATASIPPPEGIVCDPVVSGSVASMSVD
jgi:hypothetical protein